MRSIPFPSLYPTALYSSTVNSTRNDPQRLQPWQQADSARFIADSPQHVIMDEWGDQARAWPRSSLNASHRRLPRPLSSSFAPTSSKQCMAVAQNPTTDALRVTPSPPANDLWRIAGAGACSSWFCHLQVGETSWSRGVALPARGLQGASESSPIHGHPIWELKTDTSSPDFPQSRLLLFNTQRINPRPSAPLSTPQRLLQPPYTWPPTVIPLCRSL